MPSVAVRQVEKDAKTGKKRFRRRNYFTNRSFQMAFAGNMLLIAAGATAITALAVSCIFVYVLNDHLTASLTNQAYLIKLAVVLCFMAAGVIIWAVLRSHAVAGPVSKTRRILKEAAEGNIPPGPVSFRRGDAFQDLGEDINLLLDALREGKQRMEQEEERLAALKDLLLEDDLADKDRLDGIKELIADYDPHIS